MGVSFSFLEKEKMPASHSENSWWKADIYKGLIFFLFFALFFPFFPFLEEVFYTFSDSIFENIKERNNSTQSP